MTLRSVAGDDDYDSDDYEMAVTTTMMMIITTVTMMMTMMIMIMTHNTRNSWLARGVLSCPMLQGRQGSDS